MSTLSRIAGIVYPDPLQVDRTIFPMLNMMSAGSNGVKDSASYKNIMLGTIGSKVFFNESKDLILVFDGYLNNLSKLYHDLKGELPSENIENIEIGPLIIDAYEKWEEEFLEKIDGSFALALFNKETHSLLLARDRIGIKPLYWYQGNNTLFFASELKAILSTGQVPQTPALDAMAMYLYFGFIPQDLSPIKDVNKLLPGNYLMYSPHKGVTVRSYWSYSSYYEKVQNTNPDVIKEKLSEILKNATASLLPSKDKAVGCFVSGGLGSSTTALEVSQQRRLQGASNDFAYTVGFRNEDQDDVEKAAEVCKIVGLDQSIDYITAHTITEDLIEIVWQLDEPLADPHVISTWKLAGLAEEETDVVFSGMGSDEFLAGHNRYTNSKEHKASFRFLNLIPKVFFDNVILPLINFVKPAQALKLLKFTKTNPWQFEFLRENAIFDEKKMLEVSPKLARYFDAHTFLHKFHHIGRIHSTVGSLIYFDTKTRLPDLYIHQFERLTHAKGLSWRSPFLDRKLIEYAAGLPEPENLSETQTASYLKPFLQDYFPSSIINRPKKSRKLFLKDWTKNSELQAIFELLLTGTLVETGLISKQWLNNQIQNPKPDENNFLALWSILVLEVWFHLFINHPIRPSLLTTNLKELLSEP